MNQLILCPAYSDLPNVSISLTAQAKRLYSDILPYAFKDYLAHSFVNTYWMVIICSTSCQGIGPEDSFLARTGQSKA